MNSKTIRILSLVGKATGLALTIAGPFQGSTTGLIIFAVASIVKDSINRLGDIFDDGRPNDSFKQ
jgi:hypothetical protein